ncbi:unnamed protein product [Pedinophyceae sp. YPF-701]|nr:unnamed protein product [Pedinophyceae sp. YPF-701]
MGPDTSAADVDGERGRAAPPARSWLSALNPVPTLGEWAHRARAFPKELTWMEVSGSLGDLGTFLPLLIGLVQKNGLDLGTTLVATGVYNVVSGLHFGIPVPVQPMKSIAAVALSETPLSVPQIAVAGIAVSGVVTILGLTRVIDHFNRIFPLEVIRGIQLGLGLKLAIQGLSMALYRDAKEPNGLLPFLDNDGLAVSIVTFFAFLLINNMSPPNATPRLAAPAPARPRDLEAGSADTKTNSAGPSSGPSDSTLPRPPCRCGIACCGHPGECPCPPGCGCCSVNPSRRGSVSEAAAAPVKPEPAADAVAAGSAVSRWTALLSVRVPAALVAVVVGLIMGVAVRPSVVTDLRPGPSKPTLILPGLSWADTRDALVRAALPQLPLTTLNSVVSVCQLSGDLFPHNPAKPAAMATSVGLMNLVGGWFGAMPCCHGAGGLAAQARFGARTGAAPVFLGLVKLVLGLLLGSSLIGWLEVFPQTILGVMLVYSGLELASVAKAQKGAKGTWVMLFTAAAATACKNTFAGFVCGMIVALALVFQQEGWRALALWVVGRAPLRVEGAGKAP